jgi:hypothetical protein
MGRKTEYVTNEDGEDVPFSKLGNTVAEYEIREAKIIPFLDSNSPWHTAVPVDDVQRDRPDDVLDGLEEAKALERSNSSSESEISEDSMPASNDPIDMLTVKRETIERNSSVARTKSEWIQTRIARAREGTFSPKCEKKTRMVRMSVTVGGARDGTDVSTLVVVNSISLPT